MFVNLIILIILIAHVLSKQTSSFFDSESNLFRSYFKNPISKYYYVVPRSEEDDFALQEFTDRGEYSSGDHGKVHD